jgi:hypothetical protein
MSPLDRIFFVGLRRNLMVDVGVPGHAGRDRRSFPVFLRALGPVHDSPPYASGADLRVGADPRLSLSAVAAPVAFDRPLIARNGSAEVPVAC